jgi:hypothetical protein
LTSDSARASLVRDIVRRRGLSEVEALDLCRAVERSVASVQRAFHWVRGSQHRDALITKAWTVVAEKWEKWSPEHGPPAPYFRMILSHELTRSIRAEHPRCVYTKGKNKPKLLGFKVAIEDSWLENDGVGGRVTKGAIHVDKLPADHEVVDDAWAAEGRIIRMHAALLAACGGDQDELDRVINAEKATDPEGVELRAKRRTELRKILALGVELGLEDEP